MVGVAQLVEHWLVVPVVAGSSPVVHPMQRMWLGFGRATSAFRPFTAPHSPDAAARAVEGWHRG
jgi:hypothetical protein